MPDIPKAERELTEAVKSQQYQRVYDAFQVAKAAGATTTVQEFRARGWETWLANNQPTPAPVATPFIDAEKVQLDRERAIALKELVQQGIVTRYDIATLKMYVDRSIWDATPIRDRKQFVKLATIALAGDGNKHVDFYENDYGEKVAEWSVWSGAVLYDEAGKEI